MGKKTIVLESAIDQDSTSNKDQLRLPKRVLDGVTKSSQVCAVFRYPSVFAGRKGGL